MKAKYRPFKHSEEFIQQTGLNYGDEIEIRNKSKHYVLTIHGIFGDGLILANHFVKGIFTFKGLFEKYQIRHNNKWKTFGVEE